MIADHVHAEQFLGHGAAPAAGGALAWMLPMLVVVLPGVLYLVGVRRLRRGGRAWRNPRTASFGLGLTLAAVALSPPVEAAAVDARWHMAQHLLLGMYAPLALVLGAPATLLLSAVPVRSRRPASAVLRSRALHLLSHVATAAVLSVGGLYLLYLTPLYALTARSDLAHHLMHVHFLFAGYLFAWAVAGPDPAPRRPSTGLRIAVLIVAGGAHSVLAKVLYARAPELPPGGGHGTVEMQAAAQWMYYGGHLGDLLLLTALFGAWYARTGRRLPVAAATPWETRTQRRQEPVHTG